MGGRAVFGVFLGIAIVALATFVVKRWAPSPADHIEWVHGESSIIVQMKTMPFGGPAGLSDPRRHSAYPSFTLYGDGTLVYSTSQPPKAPSMKEAKISEADVAALLAYIDGTGFFNFKAFVTQPLTGILSTTFIFAAEKERQNAVGAQPIEVEVPSPPPESPKLQRIKSRLDKIVADSEARSTLYAPDSIVLVVRKRPSNPGPDQQPHADWPFPDIDLSTIAGAEVMAVGEKTLDGGQARAIVGSDPPIDEGIFLQTGVLYDVAYRPVLPHEDNFPEFEPVNG